MRNKRSTCALCSDMDDKARWEMGKDQENSEGFRVKSLDAIFMGGAHVGTHAHRTHTCTHAHTQTHCGSGRYVYGE